MFSQFSSCFSINSFNTLQSSKPAFMPCPKKGTMACAASPIKQKLSFLIHGKHFTVTNEAVGLLKNCLFRSGIRATTSGKFSWKKLETFSTVFKLLNDNVPSKGKNKVPVKLPS